MSFKKIQYINPNDIGCPEEGYIYFGRDTYGLWEKYSDCTWVYITTGMTTGGNDGTSGSSGKDGYDGTFFGSHGTSGSSGKTGTSGSSGKHGTNGSSGRNGTAGTSGSSGLKGTSGSSGDSGTSGSSGSSGETGSSGTSGTGSSGTSGEFGSSGTSGINGGYGGATRMWFYTGSTMPSDGYFFVYNNTYSSPDLSIINRMEINVEDSDLQILGNWIRTWTGGTLKIEDRMNFNIFGMYSLNGAIVTLIYPNIYEITNFTLIDSSGGIPTENGAYLISVVGGGSGGGTGSSGTSGTGSPGSSGTSGTGTGSSGTSGTGSPGSSGTSGVSLTSTISGVTYLDLVNLINNSGLTIGGSYRITDFRTVNYYTNTISGTPFTITGTTNVGNIEPLIVKSLSGDTLNFEAYSELYPNDVIYYDWNPNNYLGDKSFSHNGIDIVSGFTGLITLRHDKIKNVSCDYDFRNVKFRRWALKPTGWNSGVTYSHGDTVFHDNGYGVYLYVSSVDSNLNNEPNVIGPNWITAFSFDSGVTFSNYKYLSNSSSNILYPNLNSTFIVDPDDYMDFYTFNVYSGSSLSSNVYDVNLKTINNDPYSYKRRLGNNVFLTSQYIVENNFGQYFYNNTIITKGSKGCYNNILRNFYNNIVGLGDGNDVSFVYNNVIQNFEGNSFGTSDIYGYDGGIHDNICGNFKFNSLKAGGCIRISLIGSSTENKINNSIMDTIIENGFNNNIINYYIQSCTLLSGFTNNTIDHIIVSGGINILFNCSNDFYISSIVCKYIGNDAYSIVGDTPSGGTFSINTGSIYIPQGTANKYLALDNNNIVVYMDLSGGTISTGITIVDILYNDLVTLINNSGLTEGNYYKITDFRTVHYFVDDGTTINFINYGQIEPLTIRANSTKDLDFEAYSELYPSDVIYYDWNPSNWLTDGFFTLDTINIVSGFTGIITFRHNIIKNVSCDYDFRNVKFRRWALKPDLWNSGTYALGSIVLYTDEYIYLALNSNAAEPTVDDNNWVRILYFSNTYDSVGDYPNYKYLSPTSSNLNYANYLNIDVNSVSSFIPVDSGDTIDVYTFNDLSGTSMLNYESNLYDVNNFIKSYSDYRLMNNVFYVGIYNQVSDNEILYSSDMTFSNFQYLNKIENSYYLISTGTFYNNVINGASGSVFFNLQDNNIKDLIDASFICNFSDNNIKRIESSILIGSDNNVIDNTIYGCVIYKDFNYNESRNLIYNCIILSGFTNNTIEHTITANLSGDTAIFNNFVDDLYLPIKSVYIGASKYSIVDDKGPSFDSGGTFSINTGDIHIPQGIANKYLYLDSGYTVRYVDVSGSSGTGSSGTSGSGTSGTSGSGTSGTSGSGTSGTSGSGTSGTSGSGTSGTSGSGSSGTSGSGSSGTSGSGSSGTAGLSPSLFSWVIDTPEVGGIPGPRIYYGMTMLRVDSYCITGNSVTFNIEDRTTIGTTGTDLMVSNQVATTTGATNTISVSVSANHWLWLEIKGVSGIVDKLVVSLASQIT